MRSASLRMALLCCRFLLRNYLAVSSFCAVSCSGLCSSMDGKTGTGGGAYLKPYARQFYKSKAWQKTRDAYASSKRNLCEVCLAKGIVTPAEIVHHKIEITPENITDPTVTLNWNNLQCVCRECHAEAHGARQNRWKIDELGRVYAKE